MGLPYTYRSGKEESSSLGFEWVGFDEAAGMDQCGTQGSIRTLEIGDILVQNAVFIPLRYPCLLEQPGSPSNSATLARLCEPASIWSLNYSHARTFAVRTELFRHCRLPYGSLILYGYPDDGLAAMA
jgi:hypothetical protein